MVKCKYQFHAITDRKLLKTKVMYFKTYATRISG